VEEFIQDQWALNEQLAIFWVPPDQRDIGNSSAFAPRVGMAIRWEKSEKLSFAREQGFSTTRFLLEASFAQNRRAL